MYSWVASAGSEKQWVLFNNKKHFIHSFSLTDGQVISITAKKNLRTSAASSQYAKAAPLGEKSCASFLSFLLMLAVCKKKKNGWWIKRRIWVVGIALTASLWPHWLFYFWLQCYSTSSDSFWTFCVYCSFSILFFLSFFLSFCVDLLPSDTVGRFCSVWNMILKSFTHLNFRVTEEEKKKTEKNEYPVHSQRTYTCKNGTKMFFFKKKKKSQAMYIW